MPILALGLLSTATLMIAGVAYCLRSYPRSWQIMAIMAFAVWLLAGYYVFGQAQQLWYYQAQLEKDKKMTLELQAIGSPEALLQRFSQVVAQKSSDPQAWFLYGKLQLGLGLCYAAEQSLQQALKLKPQAVDIRSALIEAQIQISTQASLQAAQQLLALQPPDELNDNWRAIIAYRQGDYAQAIKQWRLLLPNLSKEAQAAINQMLEKAIFWQNKPLQRLAVTLVWGLSAKQVALNNDKAWVYVYAMSEDSRLPLAIRRYRLLDLPQLVELTTLDAMLPDRSLAEVKAVRIKVRIVNGDIKNPDQVLAEETSSLIDKADFNQIVKLKINFS